jgi:hypothetical protein
MADKCTYEETSRLLNDSAIFRDCSIAFNSAGYTPNNEYCQLHEDTIADGDCKGRDPQDGDQQNPSIGTNKDVDMRNCSMAKNAALYTPGNEYKALHEDTIADGDCKGRDPEDGDQQNPSIGTNKDVSMRECLMAKNSGHYTQSNQYLPGHEDTMSDGDNRGRDPEDTDAPIGTNIDIENRTCLIAKNAGLYTPGNEYSAGSKNV